MEFFIQLVITAAGQVAHTFLSNWPFLLASVLIATLLKLYLNPTQVSAFLKRYQNAGVVAATSAAVTTPLCSCGTTAVILGMMAGSVPWAPVVAFMVASPLTSLEELVYSAGLFGWPFAWAFFISSILLGLAGGMLAGFAENRGWLAGQSRIPQDAPRSECACGSEPAPESKCGCGSEPASESACACDRPAEPPQKPKVTAREFLTQAFQTGKLLLVMFFGFAFIGYLLNGLIPPGWVAAVFGSGNVYSIPLAATLGLPLYINYGSFSAAGTGLARCRHEPGRCPGLPDHRRGHILGAIAGALAIARWRVIALVVGTLWAGAILLGYVYNFMA